MTIWKYPLEITDYQAKEIPNGAAFLSIQIQGGVPCVWALVDENARLNRYFFRVYGTGHPVDEEPGKYIGTFQVGGGSLVFHCFVRDGL